MQVNTKKSAGRILALLLAMALCLSLLVGAAPGSAASSDGEWVQVTSTDEFTTGQYYMVTDTGYAPGVYEDGWILPVEAANAPEEAIWTLTITGAEVTLQDQNGSFVKPKGGNSNGISKGE